MASIVITINTDGAAFHDDRSTAMDRVATNTEIVRVLRNLANRFPRVAGRWVPVPLDIDGDAIGTVEIID